MEHVRTYGQLTQKIVYPGRSRLAPIKQMSMPCLELSGAVVTCRLYAMLGEELEINIDEVTFWTDSKVVKKTSTIMILNLVWTYTITRSKDVKKP